MREYLENGSNKSTEGINDLTVADERESFRLKLDINLCDEIERR